MADPSSAVYVVFAETDYRYGVGPLPIRIEHVDRANPVRYDAEAWYRVVGVQIGHHGAELGHRTVLVRGRRLPPAG